MIGLLMMRMAIQVELGLWAADSAGVGSSSKGSPSFLPDKQALFHFVRVVQTANIIFRWL